MTALHAAKPPFVKPLRAWVLFALVYAAVSLMLQAKVPVLPPIASPPVVVFSWIALAVALGVMGLQALRARRRGEAAFTWLVAFFAILVMSGFDLAGALADRIGLSSAATERFEYFADAALAALFAAATLGLWRLSRGAAWLRLALIVVVAFQLSALALDYFEARAFIAPSGDAVLSAQLAKLLCVEFLLIIAALAAVKARKEANRLALPERLRHLPATAIGTRMREVLRHGGVVQTANHPPVRLAYYPVFKELTVLAATLVLVAWAGPRVRAAMGVPLWRQAAQMIWLWFREGIDPPSYYQVELYRPDNRKAAGEYLTRYETKNGMLRALNKMAPSPYRLNEMNYKSLFYEQCVRLGLPHARILAFVESDAVDFQAERAALATDLFCKPQKGVGAKGALAFRFDGSDRYDDTKHHRTVDLDGVMDEVAARSKGRRMIVQAWLRNHPEIADLAGDSLITFRIVTCLDENGRPEVTLAMLRILAKLEPAWHASDGEYAAPIDLATGRLGLLTGDNMATSLLRYASHPVTGAPIEGRLLAGWPQIRDLALAAHRGFIHRTVVGWDIAYTPQGPLLLEGNNQFDVMFLQRVHDLPAGRTRLGVLFSHHLDRLVATLASPDRVLG
jgi:Sugar-transfer associated ATP-grasp